ncbi:MAG: hypothetical protein JSS63_02440 [Bacteroidetes bacterium]|nr:hypothetical protein [Bacteroidota bacterium]
MSLGKNTKRIRMFGGNNLQIKLPSGWTNLGHVITGTIEDKTDSQEVTFADGNTLDLDGKRKVKVSITLAQTSKEEIELIDTLRGGVFTVFYYNGLVDSKPQAFYFKEVNIIPNLSLKSPDNPMNIVMEMSVLPQPGVFSIDTNSPYAIPAGTEVATYTPGLYYSSNNFYVIIEGNGAISGT